MERCAVALPPCPSDLIHPGPWAPMSRSSGTSIVTSRSLARTPTPRRDALRGCVDRPKCEPSGSDSDVPVVESSKDEDGGGLGRAIDLWRALGGDRGLATDALTRLDAPGNSGNGSRPTSVHDATAIGEAS